MEERYIATMVLHAVGDTVGFKNGSWEFKEGGMEKCLEKLYEFIYLGGVNHISLKGWLVSDDTILHIKTAEGLIESHDRYNRDRMFGIFVKKYIEGYEQFVNEKDKKRYPGNTTIKNIYKFMNGSKWVKYDESYGGSGASMRTSCIGLMYYDDFDKLVETSIESSRITHNSAVGYLGGFAVAYMISMAVRGVKVEDWMKNLYGLFMVEDKIGKYIKGKGVEYEEYERDKHNFLEKIDRYLNFKFGKGGIIYKKTDMNVLARSEIYYKNFSYKSSNLFIGSSGDDSVIIAYDCFLDCEGIWEKLVVYSMLHIGDTDTTGSIAGSFYGAVYGFKGVPDNFLKHLEFSDKLESIGKDIYKKIKGEN